MAHNYPGVFLTPMSYAHYLSSRLSALGLSRNALARALGHRGASQVSRWCSGKAVPREKARTKIEAALAHTEPFTKYRKPPETPQDAPGGPISGGEVPEGTPFVVERYVVEGG